MEDKISWKRARAKATGTFKHAKRQDMQQYVESMKVNTPPAKIYGKLRKIRGKPHRKINMLTGNKRLVATKTGIVNCLAEAFAKISDLANCSTEFKKIKEKKEGKAINFDSDNAEPYDYLFIMTELTTAINNSKDTAPILDNIHYSMFKHLPEKARQELLRLLSRVWTTTYFPDK